jgi:DNA-binding NtrC family response regulator
MKFLLIDGSPQESPTATGELVPLSGVEILEANDANSLMDLLQTDSLDLVIIEYEQWTDGLQALSEVKRERLSCPVFMFTKTGGRSVTVKTMKRADEPRIMPMAQMGLA